MTRGGPINDNVEVRCIRPLHLFPWLDNYPNHSSVFRGYNGMSSDSLSSLWNGTATEADLDALARTTSSGGHSDRAVLGTARRSTSAAQPERSAPMPLGRAISRSNLSQTSLATASPVSSLPREMGSSSSHAFDLLQSYATAFPVREGSRRPSTSHSSKSFALPASIPLRLDETRCLPPGETRFR